ncbi:hypothetical protein LBMAG47_03690 [Planctomycetia bacterium]|jgi:predicted RNA binding protein YcfA (HicA-like mRNA interferase family)/predicted RNase H-like HicB family nuclease|nr:hypothetical protein LBMAG47_03690 [Planctomycetia bacterium]
MPRKIRELVRDLVKAGFEERSGKGSHRNYSHPLVAKVVTISGRDGDDARRHLEKTGQEAINDGEPMAKGDRYVKVVEWSDDDKCFVGTCPQLMYGGSYGDDATKVFVELCEMVEEAIETLEEAGKPLPQPLPLHALGSVLQRSA